MVLPGVQLEKSQHREQEVLKILFEKQIALLVELNTFRFRFKQGHNHRLNGQRQKRQNCTLIGKNSTVIEGILRSLYTQALGI